MHPADAFPPALVYRHDPPRAIQPDVPVSHAIARDRAMPFRTVRTVAEPNVMAALPVQSQPLDALKYTFPDACESTIDAECRECVLFLWRVRFVWACVPARPPAQWTKQAHSHANFKISSGHVQVNIIVIPSESRGIPAAKSLR